jgi:hypothetical protein
MSNLSELLPAGAGAKSADFVASGTIGNGVTVILNSDGTITEAGLDSIGQSLGSSTTFNAGLTRYTSCAYDPVEKKVIVVYMDDSDSDYGKAVVGTVSGSNISFGSEVVFSNYLHVGFTNVIYDSGSNVVVIAYMEQNYYPAVVAGTVSGNSISFGSPARVATVETGTAPVIAYSSTDNKFVVFYQDKTSFQNYLKCKVGTISGTSISYGSEVTVRSSSTQDYSCDYDAANDKIVISYRNDGSSGYLDCNVGTISGTSISFSTTVVVASETSRYSTTNYTPSPYQRVIVGWAVNSGSYEGKVRVGNIISGNIAFGTTYTFFSSSRVHYLKATYDINAEKIVFAWRDGTSPNYGKLIAGTVTGSVSLSFGSAINFYTGAVGNEIGLAYDPDDYRIIVSYHEDNANRYGKTVLFQNSQSVTNITTTNFIGISDAAISDTSTGAVIVQGGVSTNVSGLTIGSDYYVQANGTLSTTTSTVPAGRALSSTSILLEG